MTKAEEAKYIEEYNRGEHMLSLEEYKADQRKQAKTAAKTRTTLLKHQAEEVAKVAAASVITPVTDMLRQKDAIIAELNEKIIKLSEENARLKAATNEIRYKTLLDAGKETSKNAPKTTPVTSEPVNKPQIIDNSDISVDIPMDIFSSSICARKYGARGIKLLKLLDHAALTGAMYFETANRYAKALGLDKKYNFTTVVPPVSEKEMNDRAQLRKILDKIALQIGEID